MKGAIAKADEIMNSDPATNVLLQQFKNPANPPFTIGPPVPRFGRYQRRRGCFRLRYWNRRHHHGRVALYQTGSRKDYLVASSGRPSPVITQRGAATLKPGPHKIQGNRRPASFRDGSIFPWWTASRLCRTKSPLRWLARLAREEGILSGIIERRGHPPASVWQPCLRFEGKTIVVLLPDSGERYLSTFCRRHRLNQFR